jgi:hypothetical protein
MNPFGFLFFIAAAASVHAGTIAHYKFETTETNRPLARLVDSSGNGHHGIVLGREPFDVTADVPPFPAATRTALDARGRLDYGIIPHHPDFAPQGDWTIEFFVKPSLLHHSSGGETNIGSYPAINTNLSYTILAKPNPNEPTLFGVAWAFHYQPAKGWIVDRTAVENEVGIFLDGYKTTSINQHGGNLPIPFGDGPIYVGAFSEQTVEFSRRDRNFDGLIDEIRFSDTALDTETFLVDLTPKPIDVEIYPAVEIRFHSDNQQL